MSADDQLERDLDALLVAAGITVPAEWRAGVVAVHRELRAMAALVRQGASADTEPATVYRMSGPGFTGPR